MKTCAVVVTIWMLLMLQGMMAPHAQHAAADASYEGSSAGFGTVDPHEAGRPNRDAAKRPRF
jgi:hypothetical protein